MNTVKRGLYILLFMILGGIIGFIIHSAIEIFILTLLVSNYSFWSLGLAWPNWVALHHIGTACLVLYGMYVGFSQGKIWWVIVYVSRREKDGKTPKLSKI